MSTPILEIQGLVTTFPGPRATRTPVVDGISLQIQGGEIMALVGESGSGKSMTALSAMRLVPKPGRVESNSRILFKGDPVLSLSVPAMRALRGAGMAMIFQEPMTSLNPVQQVGRQVVEGIRLHEKVSFSEARKRTITLFERVGIPDPEQRFSTFPHQLSGGLKQRIMIAMALAMRSTFLIADEPTTALDVTVQAQILDLLCELRDDMGTAILLITHDLGVVNEVADNVAVMYAGKIVESGSRRQILHNARHPYTQGLLRAMPANAPRNQRLAEIEGVVPRPGEWPKGCRFSTRCSQILPPCADHVPPEVQLADSHTAFCHAVAQEPSS